MKSHEAKRKIEQSIDHWLDKPWARRHLPAAPQARRRLLYTTLGVVLGLPILLQLGELYLLSSLPPVEALKNYDPPQTTEIFSNDGQLMGQLFRERRTVVPLASIPTEVKNAFLATEDAGFYAHSGLDYMGIVRAALKNLRPGSRRQGASTITQQTVKALVVGSERTYTRKLHEALLARQLEKILTKDEILHIYLNQIYFGAGAYGVQEAARTYFAKSVGELSIAEAALIAGIPKHPTRFNPKTNPEMALRRRNYVLEQMNDNGWLSDEELAQTSETPIELAPAPEYLGGAPHYVEHVRRLLVEQFGEEETYEGGLRVHTAMSADLQLAAHASVRTGLESLASQSHFALPTDEQSQRTTIDGALIAIDPLNRSVRAMVGGYDMDPTGFNRATQAKRQPGSAFKPIVYAAGLAQRAITPASICPDAPVVVRDYDSGDVWKPENYKDGQYAGLITYRQALSRSINTCSVRLLERVGQGVVMSTARHMGITSPLPSDMTLALGSADLTVLELANAYATIASNGIRDAPVFVSQVKDSDGLILYTHESNPENVLDPAAAYVLTSMMRSVIQGGTGSQAAVLGRPLAGKTGTSNESRNLWFSGYSASLVATVWVGSDDNAPLNGLTGGSGALPIWIRFMRQAHEGVPAESFRSPGGVSYARIDSKTGEPTTAEAGVLEVFVSGTKPSGQAAATKPIFAIEDIEDIEDGAASVSSPSARRDDGHAL